MRRFLTIAAWALLAVLSLLGALVLLLDTSPGARLVERIANAALAETVRLEGLGPGLLSEIRLDRLELRDPSGSWAEARRIEVDWSPGALLEGELRVRRARAGELVLHRAPAGGAGEGGGFRPPLGVVVEQAAIESFRLAAGAPGGPAAFAVAGALQASRDGTISAELDGRRLDAPGSLDATLRFDGGSLAVSASVNEPPDGAVARLLRLPGAPPVALALDGSGPLGAFDLTFEASAGDARIGGEASLRSAEGGLAFRATASAEPASLLPERWRALAGPEVALAAAGLVADDGALRLDAFEARSASMSLEASGALLDGRRLSGRAAAEGGLDAVAAGVGFAAQGRWRLDVGIDGELAAPRADWRLVVDDLETEVGSAKRLRAEGVAALLADAVRVEASGEAAEPALPDLPLPPAVSFEVAAGIGRADGAVALERAALKGGPYAAEARGHVQPDGVMALDVRALASDLKAVGVRGSVEVEAAVAGPPDALRAQTQARFARLSLGAPALDAALGGTPTASAVLLRQGDSVAIEELRVRGRHAELSGAGALSAARLAFQGAATLSDLAALGAPFAGEAVVEAKLDGSPDVLSGPVSLRAKAGDVRLSAEAEARVDARRASFGKLRLEGTGLSGAGEFAWPLQRGAPRARLDAQIAEVRPWAALFGVLAEGAVDLAATLSSGELDARLEGRSVAASGARAGDFRLTTRLESFPARPQGELRLAANDVAVGEEEIRRLRLNATLRGEDAGFRLRMEAPDRFDTPVTARGSFAWSDGVRLTLARFDGRLAERTLRLEKPVTFIRRGDALRLEDLDLRLGRGRLRGAAHLDAREVGARFQAESFPLEAFLRAPGATLDGALRLEGPRHDPAATLEARLATAGPEWSGLSGLELRLDGDWRNARAKLTGELAGAPGTEATADLSFPLVADLVDWRFAMPEDGRLDGRLLVDADLAELAPLLPLDDDRIGGRLVGGLAISGSVGAPRVGGEAALRQGRYVLAATGATFRDLSFRLRGAGGRVELTDLVGADGAGGRLGGEGEFLLGERRIDARIELERMRVANSDRLRARISGDLRLTGPLNQSDLVGEIEVHEADYAIPRRLPSRVARLEVVEINRQLGGRPAPPRRPAAAAAFDPQLALDVRAPGRIFVRGRGLDSEWAGRVRVEGHLSEPQIVGSLEIVRGRFDLAGRVLELDRGVVTFPEGRRYAVVEPEIDVAATARAADILAEVRATGPASDIRIELTSQPPMPKDEILSRLLFGKGAGSLSATQAVQLGQTALELSGEGATGGLLGEVRRNLGLDFFDVEAGEGSDPIAGARVRAGKYLTDDVYLGLRQGALPGSSSAVIEYKFLPNLSIEGAVGADSQAGVGLNWEKRY